MNALPYHGDQLRPGSGRGGGFALGPKCWRWGLGGVFGLLVACGLWLFPASLRAAEASEKKPFVRLGTSTSFYAGLNENDAQAALKVWGKVIFQEQSIPVELQVKTIQPSQIGSLLKSNAIDIMAMTTEEYAGAKEYLQQDLVFVAADAGGITQEYLLLAQQTGSVRSIADLRGRTVLIHQHFRMSLAASWLDVLLVQHGLAPAGKSCEAVTHVSNLSRVVLPVFFGKADACVVTRKGYETMSELNPQLGKTLKILARSPAVVPGAVCFRRNYTSEFKERFINQLENLDKSPAGQQVLTIFQAERIMKPSVTCLDSALELLATHRRLCQGQGELKSSKLVQAAPEREKP